MDPTGCQRYLKNVQVLAASVFALLFVYLVVNQYDGAWDCFSLTSSLNHTIPSSFFLSAVVFVPLHRIHHQDPRQLLGPSSKKKIFKGRILGDCPENVATKIQDRATRPPVGTDLLLRATSNMEGGLTGQLERADGLAGFKALLDKGGAEIGIDLDQRGGNEEVLEITVGQCNNQTRNFFEHDLHTARVHRALRAAVSLTSSSRPLVQKNKNNGGCEQTVDAKGGINCRLNNQYPAEQLEAAREIENGMYDKIAHDFPGRRVVVEHEFGDFLDGTHKKDGRPVVTRDEFRGGLVRLRPWGRHLCQIPGSPASLLSNVEVRLALRAHAARELGRHEGSDYNDHDIAKGVLDVLEILATGEEEYTEYQQSFLKPEKTDDLCDDGGEPEDAAPGNDHARSE